MLEDLPEADRTMYETYGILYNQPAAETACPPGTHLPSDEEWHSLESFFATEECELKTGWRCSPAGTHLKATSTWSESGKGDNISGFNVLPSGIYHAGTPYGGADIFGNQGYYARFWSSSKEVRRALESRADIYRDRVSRAYGFSVRCVQ